MSFESDLPAADAQLESLLRERRFGPPDIDENTPWSFIDRWGPEVVRRRVWPVMSKLLVDSDPVMRARVVEFIGNWEDGAKLTMPRLLDVAEHHLDMFDDQDTGGLPLHHYLAYTLASRALWDDHARIATVLQRIWERHPGNVGAAAVIAMHAPDFLAKAARAQGDDASSWLDAAAGSVAMYRRDAILPFLANLTGLSLDIRRHVVDVVDKFVRRDDAEAVRIAGDKGLPPPRKPAPTVDQLRAAIGLTS